jgi:hypothetical protein
MCAPPPKNSITTVTTQETRSFFSWLIAQNKTPSAKKQPCWSKKSLAKVLFDKKMTTCVAAEGMMPVDFS